MEFLRQTAHRPWPLPEKPWLFYMEWNNLLFLHYPIPPDSVLPHIPDGLTLETWDGSAWLSVVAFITENSYPRGLAVLKGSLNFLELNLRTYVTHDSKPGIFFFSLDANNQLAVRGARLGFHLPYFDARMRWEIQGRCTRYLSTRTHQKVKPGTFEGSYEPAGPLPQSQQGTLQHWLTERYCLYSTDPGGHLYRCQIHHQPWPLEQVDVHVRENTLGHLIDVPLLEVHSAQYSKKQCVVGWNLERVR